ncbi:MAG: YihY/virulence factor BrkB family protein, partial [Luteolibacter sp.]
MAQEAAKSNAVGGNRFLDEDRVTVHDPRVTAKLIRTICFARRVLRDFFFENNGLLLTGAVAYGAMLSMVPLAAVMVVFFSHFFDEKLLMEALTTELSLISPEASPMVSDVLATFLETRRLAGWIGGLALLFFSSMAFRTLENAFAIIFHRKAPSLKRSFWVSALIPYLFIGLVAAGLIVLTAMTAVVESSVGQTYVFGGFAFGLQWLASAGLHVAGFLALVLLFTTLYKVMPVTKISFRLALSGGITAALMWETLRSLLVRYFSHLSLVNDVYGSMATTIILLLTMEAAALIILLGAQVIAELQRNRRLGIPWDKDPKDLVKAAIR